MRSGSLSIRTSHKLTRSYIKILIISMLAFIISACSAKRDMTTNELPEIAHPINAKVDNVSVHNQAGYQAATTTGPKMHLGLPAGDIVLGETYWSELRKIHPVTGYLSANVYLMPNKKGTCTQRFVKEVYPAWENAIRSALISSGIVDPNSGNTLSIDVGITYIEGHWGGGTIEAVYNVNDTTTGEIIFQGLIQGSDESGRGSLVPQGNRVFDKMVSDNIRNFIKQLDTRKPNEIPSQKVIIFCPITIGNSLISSTQIISCSRIDCSRGYCPEECQ